MTTLSLDEKIRLLSGTGMWKTNDCNGKLSSIHMSDGPHGLRKQESGSSTQNNDSIPATCFPTESALACSFDTELVSLMASALAEEARAKNVSIVLGCGVNIKRSPLCGRNFEYFSEDPYLSGKLAAAYISSMEKSGIGTSLKHFAGNSQETHRQTANSEIDERALHEIYLTAFEIAVKEGHPATVMASYNRLNGLYSCENRSLLTTMLRERFGFDGVIISDWGACIDPVPSLNAGMDLEMPDSYGNHIPGIKRALDTDELKESTINQSVNRIEKLIEKYCQADSACPDTSYQALLEKHHKTARHIAAESAVLLKNEDFLPLKKNSEVLIIGSMAEHIRYQGGGSSHINAFFVPDIPSSLKQAGLKASYVAGYRSDTEEADSTLFSEACDAAEAAEKNHIPILFFGGLTEFFEGEGYDRTSLSLPKNQCTLFYELAKRNPEIAFISFGGAPFEIPFISSAKAVLHMYLGGEAVSEACVDLITGVANPCGKLAETFPISGTDVPSEKWFGKDTDDVEYRESLFVGYRYYDTFGKPVLFPFGHGLSYTSFLYSELSLTDEAGNPVSEYHSGSLFVNFAITNTGQFNGKEITQIYIKNPSCNYLRPSRELRGFTKTALKAGETRHVSIALNERSFSVYDENSEDFLMPSGVYGIEVSASISDIRLKTDLSVRGAEYARNDRNRLPEYFSMLDSPESFSDFNISREQFAALYGKPLSSYDNIKKGDFSVYNSLSTLSKHSFYGKLLLAFGKIAVKFMFKGKKKDDPEVLMTLQGIREGTLDSVLCQSEGLVPYWFGEAIVLSANGHSLKAFGKILKHY